MNKANASPLCYCFSPMVMNFMWHGSWIKPVDFAETKRQKTEVP